MKSSTWDKQLELASPLEHATIQSDKTKSPSNKEAGLDARRHPRLSLEGRGRIFFLTSSFIG
jgi:hypothetical protein